MNYLLKIRGYPQFSFSISITLVTIYISRIIVKWDKNTFELVGTVFKTLYLVTCNKCELLLEKRLEGTEIGHSFG